MENILEQVLPRYVKSINRTKYRFTILFHCVFLLKLIVFGIQVDQLQFKETQTDIKNIIVTNINILLSLVKLQHFANNC